MTLISHPTARIAFASLTDAAAYTSDVHMVKRDGTELVNLTRNPAGHWASEPAWSPDGTQIGLSNTIAYPTNEEGASQIYVLNHDGEGVIRISRSEMAYKIAPTWHPLGHLVAYSNQCDTDYCFAFEEVLVAKADGSKERYLTDTQRRFEGPPVWSPDGAQLVFAASQRSSAGTNLYTIFSTGRGEAKLVGGPALRARSPDW